MRGRTPRSRCAAKAHRRAWEQSGMASADRLSCRSRNSAALNCRGVDARLLLRCVSLPCNASPDDVLVLAACFQYSIYDVCTRAMEMDNDGDRARHRPLEFNKAMTYTGDPAVMTQKRSIPARSTISLIWARIES